MNMMDVGLLLQLYTSDARAASNDEKHRVHFFQISESFRFLLLQLPLAIKRTPTIKTIHRACHQRRYRQGRRCLFRLHFPFVRSLDRTGRVGWGGRLCASVWGGREVESRGPGSVVRAVSTQHSQSVSQPVS